MSSAPDPGRAVFPSFERASEGGAPWTFARYLVWRLVVAVAVLFLVLTLVFYLVEVQTGDPTRILLPRGGCGGSPSQGCPLRDQVMSLWGLDKPVLERYAIFLTNVFTGNLGPSITTYPGVPVTEILGSALPATLLLLGIGLLADVALGLLLGLPLSRRRGGLADSVVSFLLAIPFALPVFAFALGMIALFAIAIPVFPLFGTTSPNYAALDPVGQFLDSVWHLVLPLLVLILAGWGLFVWVVRDHPLRPAEAMVSAAPGEWRPKALSLRTRMRAALPRFLPAISALLGWTLGSVIVVDGMFGLNGLGSLLWRATLNLDYPLLMAIVLVLSLALVLPGLVAADVIHYALTKDWIRSDRLRVDRLRVDPRDLTRGFWRILLHPLGFAGLVLGLVLVVMTAAAPILVGPFPTPATAAQPLLPASPDHPLGTNSRGYDILTLTVYGGQTGIIVALAAFAFALIAELGITAAVGFFGDRADVFLGIPADLLLVLAFPFVLLLGVTAFSLSFLLFAALIAWPIPARLLRMELTGLVIMGRGRKITWTERGRRALNLIWGTGPILLGDAFLAVSLALSMWATMGLLGFRVTGATSWGEMINDWYTSLGFLQGRWEAFLAPAVCLLAAVLAPMLLSLACKSIGPTPKPVELRPVPAPVPPSAAPTAPPP